MDKEIHSFVRVSAVCEETFTYFFSMNLFSVFKGFWFMPNIKSTFFKNKTAKIGKESLIYFDDGSTAVSRLLVYIRQVSFLVQIDHFTSGTFMGLEAIRCHFCFSDSGPGMTQVRCQYQFKMHSRFWDLVFELFFRKLMQKRLDSLLIQTAREVKEFAQWKMTLDI
ncbi:hypothetical protein [Flavobacterium sp. FlaQc-47]|uniref:hypothetical protein n=1 Tax=Flavobacterium sp. FlaQc-47 TaxID=3374180 RepID=UPI00375816B3